MIPSTIGESLATPAPAVPEEPSTEGAPPAKKSLSESWNEFMNQPGNMAALVQFGIKMLQPTPVGQTTLGQLGNAVGAAGEAKQRVIEGETDRQLKQSQTDYYSGRSQYYAKGGLTPSQLLNAQWRASNEYNDILKNVMITHGALTIADLTPEEQAQVLSEADQQYQAAGFPMVPGGGAPSLGAAVASPRERTDTEGRRWRVQNGEWVQVG